MSPTVALLASNAAHDEWALGPVVPVGAGPSAVRRAMDEVVHTADAVLFWGRAHPPKAELCEALLERSVDAWTAPGALAGLPPEVDLVAPTWMLNSPAHPDVEATAWRLDPTATLVRTPALRHFGVDGEFDTVSGAFLDLGLRMIRFGGVVRHTPRLGAGSPRYSDRPSDSDGLRLVDRTYGRRWAYWASVSSALSSPRSWPGAMARLRVVRAMPPAPATSPYERPPDSPSAALSDVPVTIVVPTVDRYPYLRVLLRQLDAQTRPPLEVIVVDQTAVDGRATDLEAEAPSVDVRVLTQDEPGQCSSRNAAILAARGEMLLFLDDDDEIPTDLIERHLQHMADTGADASCGVADEVGTDAQPVEFTFPRVSWTFPTNNSLVRRDLLHRSGLFDPAFERGARADHDLGSRLYRSGGLLMLDPDSHVLHHHAPAGGLRVHGARVVTRASSRRSLTERHLWSVTQAYLFLRYFSPEQVDSAQRISALATLSGEGSRAKRAAGLFLSLFRLPDTWRRLREVRRQAETVLADRPEIPTLPGSTHAQ